MCYNLTQYREFYRCAHRSMCRQQMVDCNKKNCRFSGTHEMRPHDCAMTCKQEMLPNQTITTDAHDKCLLCAGRANGY